MFSRFVVLLALLSLVSITCLGQGLVTPRRQALRASKALSNGDQKADAPAPRGQPENTEDGLSPALPAALPVSAIKIKAAIDGQVATVRVTHLFRNETDDVLEGTYYFPVPEGATFIEFAVYDGDERRVGRVKDKEQAARQAVNPAILEMTRNGWFQSRVYPIAPRSEKRIEIVYSQKLLLKDNVATFDYPLGRGYKRLKVPVGTVELDLDVRSSVGIRNVFSPTHPVKLQYDGDRHVTTKLSTVGRDGAENFQLVYSLSDEENDGRGNTASGDDSSQSNAAYGQATHTQSGPGFVVNQSGAVVAGATVTIKDEKTGAARTVTTDSTGSYSVAGLPPGSYTVEVNAPGFKNTQVQNVVVQPGQVAATGVTLSPGGVSESVTVTGVAPALINSTSSQIKSNIESRKIRELPNLAPVNSLARLAPGTSSDQPDSVTRQATGVDESGEGRLRFNGNRAQSNSYLLNGMDNSDINGRPVILINNFDSIDSLFIMMTRGTGDISLTGASSVSLLTRSGTNDFHGTVYDYHLNRRLGALSPLERRAGLEREPLFKETLYGGTFGGPIRRDRLFFFGSFQGEHLTSDRFIDSTASLLTPTARGLSELARAFPDSTTVADLILRGPLARSLGGPQIQRSFSIPVLGMPVEFGEVTRVIPSKARGYESGGRLDYNVTNRDRLQFDYWYTSRNETNSIGRLAAGYVGETNNRSQLGGVQRNRMLSPRTSNELGIGFTRARLRLDAAPDTASASEESDPRMNRHRLRA